MVALGSVPSVLSTEVTSFGVPPRSLVPFFFFQAEDGIRDLYVTGVQTCALPICSSRNVPPRALEPAGVALVDKPAGPSSFAIVAQIRRVTGARTGHAGTLDPFATGLLLVLSGRATSIASCLVGLDKRYLTDVDLTARTSTGDPEGERGEPLPLPTVVELEQRLARLRGEVDLPIPAASAVKIGGERAYRLHRKGVAVEMPVRRS